MSRQNKVNPGMYTQRGRLTQDDAARELRKQRVIGSPHTWQPVQRDHQPPMIEEPEQEDAGDDRQDDEVPAAIEKQPARAKAAKPAAAKSTSAKRSAAPTSKRPAKTAERKAAGAKKATTATKRGKAKTAAPARAAKSKATTAKPKARTAKPKAKAAKRRKS